MSNKSEPVSEQKIIDTLADSIDGFIDMGEASLWLACKIDEGFQLHEKAMLTFRGNFWLNEELNFQHGVPQMIDLNGPDCGKGAQTRGQRADNDDFKGRRVSSESAKEVARNKSSVELKREDLHAKPERVEDERAGEPVQSDAIPGKMPSNAIGKLAVEGACQIECGAGKQAIAPQVIEKLQETEPVEKEKYCPAVDSDRVSIKLFKQVACKKNIYYLLDIFEKVEEVELRRKDLKAKHAPVPGKVGAVPASKLKSKAVQQEDEVLRIIEDVLSLKPLELPRVQTGRAGTKARVRKMLGIPSDLFGSEKVFNTTWERLRNNNKVNEKESG